MRSSCNVEQLLADCNTNFCRSLANGHFLWIKEKSWVVVVFHGRETMGKKITHKY